MQSEMAERQNKHRTLQDSIASLEHEAFLFDQFIKTLRGTDEHAGKMGPAADTLCFVEVYDAAPGRLLEVIKRLSNVRQELAEILF